MPSDDFWNDFGSPIATAPADSAQSDAGSFWDGFNPPLRESSDALRQRLRFNLQNDYQPDQGGLMDQALFGMAQGTAGLAGDLAGISRFVGARDTANSLADYARRKRDEYQGYSETLGTSPMAQNVRAGAEFIPGVVPMVAAGAVGGMAAGPVGAQIGMSAVGGLQTLGSTEESASQAYEAQGMSPEAAAARARYPAAIGGALSAAINFAVPGGAKALLGALGTGELSHATASGILRNIIQEAGVQGLISGTDAGTQGVLAKFSYDPQRTLKEIATQALESAGVGIGMGLGIAPIHLGISAFHGLRNAGGEEAVAKPDAQTIDEYNQYQSQRGAVVPDEALAAVREILAKKNPAQAQAQEFNPEDFNQPVDVQGITPPEGLIAPEDQAAGQAMFQRILGEQAALPVAAPEPIPANPETTTPIPETIQPPVVAKNATTETAPTVAKNATVQPTVDWEASTPVEGVRVKGNYDVVDASKLVTSFDKGFDQSLQPRDRSRAASKNQIASIAMRLDPARLAEAPTTDTGAPIVDERNQVLSGNGRTAAIREAYSGGGGEQYRASLIANAVRYGVSPEAIAGMKNPVLVRRVGDYGGISKEEFTYQSNKDPLLGMGESETATADARMILENPKLLAAFAPSGEGDVLAATNRDFLNQFIQGTGDQASLLSKDGYNGPALEKRVKTAILAAMIGPKNRQAISTLLESAEKLGLKNVVNGLTTAAPRLLQLKGTDYDLTNQMAQAVQDLIRVRSEGGKIEDFLNQSDLFGDSGRTAESDFILQRLFETKSAVKVSQPMARYVELAKRIGTTVDAFQKQPTKLDVLKQAYATDNAASAIQENFALGKSPPGTQATQPALNAPDGSVQSATSRASAEAASGARKAAGIEPIRKLISDSALPDDAKLVAQKILDVAQKVGLDTAQFQLELVDQLRVRPDGIAQTGGVVGTLIRIADSLADAGTLPHEVSHLLKTMMPREVQDKIEAARVAHLPDNLRENVTPEQFQKIISGTMTSKEFFASNLPKEYYKFSNADEFFARFFEEKFARQVLGDASLAQKIRNWIKALWDGIKSIFDAKGLGEHVKNLDAIYRDALEGKFKYDPERLGSSEERASFVQTGEEAANALKNRQSEEEIKTEGEDLLAQSHAQVQAMENFDVPNLPDSVRKSLGFDDLQNIRDAGARANGAVEDYQSLRNRSDDSNNARRAGEAGQHAIRFESRLDDAIAESAKAKEELNSVPMLRRIQKYKEAAFSAIFHDNAAANAQAAIRTALNSAFDLLKQRSQTDQQSAALQGQIKGLQEVGKSRIALEKTLDDMVATLASTPDGRTALNNGGTGHELTSIYRDLKRSVGQPIQSDQLVGVASYMLGKMPELRDQLLAANFSQNAAMLGQARSALIALVDQLKKKPAATIEKMMREREKRSSNATGAEFLFLQMQKELSKDLEHLQNRITAGNVAEKIKADPNWRSHFDQVMRDQGSYGGKPIAPFKDHTEVLTLPSGRQIGVGSNRIVDSTVASRAAVTEFGEAMTELRSWLADEKNVNDPTFARRVLDLQTLESYYDLHLLASTRNPLFTAAFSILNLAVDASGTRQAPQLKAAMGLVDRFKDKVNGWLSHHTPRLSIAQREAWKSHGFDKREPAAAAQAYDDFIFQELANRAQQQSWAPKVGDKLMSGFLVTKSDIDHLMMQSKAGKELIAIAKKYDRYVLEDTRGLKKGDVNYRADLATSPYIVPRIPRYELAANQEIKSVSEAFKANAAARSPESLKALDGAFSKIWNTYGRYFVGERNPEYAHATIFDGPDGAFKVLADEIRQAPNSFPTFDSFANRIGQFTDAPPEQARAILLNEFGRIIDSWHAQMATDGAEVQVKGGDPTNSFTRARGNQLAPSPFYRTGWSTTDEVLSHGHAATSAAVGRVTDGLSAIKTELDGQKESLRAREKELALTGDESPDVAAKKQRALEQFNDETFGNWEKLDARSKNIEKAIARLSNAPIARSDFDRVFSRIVGSGVGSLIGNSLTTLRNTAGIYLVRQLQKSGMSTAHSWLGGMGFTQAQAVKIIGAMAWAVPDASWQFAKGMTQAIPALLTGKGAPEAWRLAFRGVIRALAENAPRHLGDYREMEAAGVGHANDSVAEFDNRMGSLIYRGEITKSKITAGKKIPLGFASALENSALAIANAIFPNIGDAAINSSAWWLEHSSFSHSEVFGRKIRALNDAATKRGYSRTFDFENPSNPSNLLAAKELNISNDQLAGVRKLFETMGGSFDARAVEYMARLRDDPNAKFLSAEDNRRAAETLINGANRSAFSNRPLAFDAWPKFSVFLAPLLNWPLRQMAEASSLLSTPTRSGQTVGSFDEVHKHRANAIAATMMMTALTMAIPGALSQLRDEELARFWKGYLQGGWDPLFHPERFQHSPNKQPWEYSLGDAAANHLRLSLESVPLITVLANLVIPQNTPARASYEPSFVIAEKSKDIAGTLTRAWKTGEIINPVIDLAEGMNQDLKMITSRMDSRTGLRTRSNAIALLRRFAPEDTVKPRGEFSRVNPNASPLSPFSHQMWNAAYNGDIPALKLAYEGAVQKARELGKTDPNSVVASMLRSGDPYTAALNVTSLTPTQRAQMLASMSDGQRAQFEAAEKAFADALNAVGLDAKQRVKPPTPPRNAYNLNMRSTPLRSYNQSLQLRGGGLR